jgi:phage gp29-like protein
MNREIAALLRRAAAAKGGAPDAPPTDMQLREVIEPTALGLAQVNAGGRRVSANLTPAQLTPERVAIMLRGLRNLDPQAVQDYMECCELLEEVEPQYSALLDARKKSVCALPVVLEAADDSPAAVKAADFWREQVEGDWFPDACYDLLDAIGKGFSVGKPLWETGGPLYTVASMQHIPPTWLNVDRINGKTLYLKNADSNALQLGYPLDPRQYIVHRFNRKSGIAIRGGLVLPGIFLHLAKRLGFHQLVQLLEQYGIPFRKVTYSDGMDDQDILGLQDAMTNFGVNGWAVLPRGKVDFETSDMSKTGTGESHERLLRYCDEQYAKLVAGQTQMSEAGAGSNAKASAQGLVRKDLVVADARSLAATLHGQLIVPGTLLNFGPGVPPPKLRFVVEEAKDIVAITTALEKTVPLGLQVQMSEVRDLLGFKEPQKGSEVLQPAAAPVFPGFGPADTADGGGGVSNPDALPELPDNATPAQKAAHAVLLAARACPAHGRTARVTPDKLDPVVSDDMMADWTAQSDALDAYFQQAAAGATDLETLREQMVAAVEGADLVTLRRLIATGALKARAVGVVGGAV